MISIFRCQGNESSKKKNTGSNVIRIMKMNGKLFLYMKNIYDNNCKKISKFFLRALKRIFFSCF